jgi:outer membrane biogenesis lipoprotein LolB
MPIPGTIRSRFAVVLAVAVSLLLGGCAFLQPRPQATATKTYRDPTQADLTAMEQKIKALGHVTAAHLTYDKGTFGGSSSRYAGDITSDATDQATLSSILDSSYRIIWMTPGVTATITNPVVTNPVTGQGAGAYDLGLKGAPAYPELLSRYGPRP